MTERSTTGALARAMTLAIALLVLSAACDRDRGNETAPETTTSTSATTDELRPPVEPGEVRSAVEPATDFIEDSLVTPDGLTRTYRLYVPTTLRPGEQVPLLLALHGGGGNGRQFANGSQFAGLAEANGFLVVFPDGVPQPRVASAKTWNAGACCGAAADQDVDDVGFLVALVEQLRDEYPVDPDRIHAAGHSNGSMMALRLACERGDVFASVGGQAGTLDVDECTASDPVSVVALHGTADENLPIDGGRGEFTAPGNDFPPPRAGLERLAVLAGCDGASSARETTHPDVVVEAWAGCPAGVDVEFLVVEGANHGWMGRTRAPLESRIGPAYTDLDASLTIWAFLAAHPRPSGS